MTRSARRPANDPGPAAADALTAAIDSVIADAPAPAMVPWREQEVHTRLAYTYEAITSVLGRDVRVTVHRDTYDQQSYARAELLTPAGWQPLARLLTPAVWQASYTGSTAALRRHARDDRIELLATAAQLIAHLPPSS